MTGVVAVSPPGADTFSTGCNLYISDCNRKVDLYFSTSKKDLKESKKKLKKLKDAIEYIEGILEDSN
jgi:hypothetical protein